MLLPLPAVAQVDGFAERSLHEVVDTVSSLKQHLSDGAALIKQHAVGVYYRVIDPTPLAGVRPGAAAAAIAGCLTIGGGATYCVHQGLDPIAGLSGLAAPAQDNKHAKAHPKRADAAQAPAPPVVTTAVPAASATVQQPVVQPTPPPAAQTQPSPAPQDEFDPASAGGGSGKSAQQSSPTPTKPKPATAPTGGAGEFGGP